MSLVNVRANTRNILRASFVFLTLGALAACEGPGVGPTGTGTLPAKDALGFQYERFFFAPNSQASGAFARTLRQDAVAFPVEGQLTRTRSNPIPTELMLHVKRMQSGSGKVSLTGDLVLRDLKFGGELARLENYSFAGFIPRVANGADPATALFGVIELDAIDWLSTLQCSLDVRICGEPGVVLPLSPEAAGQEVAASNTPTTLNEDGSVDLATLSNRRRQQGGAVNSGGLKPADIIAASTPVAIPPAPEGSTAPAPAPTSAAPAVGTPEGLGSTVASLGLLDRGGLWLRTPLVSAETPGRIRNSANGAELDVLLLPKEGAPGSGSQISLAALSELNASLTDLLTLIVFKLQ